MSLPLDNNNQTQVVDGKEVDTKTGEIVEETIVDFRKVHAL